MSDNLLDIHIDECKVGPNLHCIRVAGELDINTSPRLKKAIDQAIDAGHHQLVVNFTGVRYIDSTGLGVLVASRKRLQDTKGGGIALICTNKHIIKLFEITGLIKLFEIFETDEGITASSFEGASEKTSQP